MSSMGGILVFCVAEEKPTSGNLETAFRLQRIFILRVHTIKRQDRCPFLGSFIAIPCGEKRMRCHLFTIAVVIAQAPPAGAQPFEAIQPPTLVRCVTRMTF